MRSKASGRRAVVEPRALAPNRWRVSPDIQVYLRAAFGLNHPIGPRLDSKWPSCFDVSPSKLLRNCACLKTSKGAEQLAKAVERNSRPWSLLVNQEKSISGS